MWDAFLTHIGNQERISLGIVAELSRINKWIWNKIFFIPNHELRWVSLLAKSTGDNGAFKVVLQRKLAVIIDKCTVCLETVTLEQKHCLTNNNCARIIVGGSVEEYL